ncbi:hypothetical protein J4423_03100 [Candidatus Pacearchaeota archaeon]|nr:hypothetical protein [Candidatus Pacearchaeota archaeon]
MENREYEVTATVGGKPVTVTRSDLLENFKSFPLAERMERILRGEFDDIEIYLASNGPNSQAIKMRYHEK